MTPTKGKSSPAASNADALLDTASPFQVSLTEEAEQDLAQIGDAASQGAILHRALGLRHEPFKLGQPLTGPLKHFRSLQAAEQHSRIIYQVAMNTETRAVVVVIIAIYKDSAQRNASAMTNKRLK